MINLKGYRGSVSLWCVTSVPLSVSLPGICSQKLVPKTRLWFEEGNWKNVAVFRVRLVRSWNTLFIFFECDVVVREKLKLSFFYWCRVLRSISLTYHHKTVFLELEKGIYLRLFWGESSFKDLIHRLKILKKYDRLYAFPKITRQGGLELNL